MDIQTLIEKRVKLCNEARDFLDSHTDKDGKISAEDAATYDKMDAEIDALTKNIERFGRQAALDLKMEREAKTPINNPILNPLDGVSFNVKTGRASEDYKRAALTAIRSNFKQVNNLLQESIDASGGYLVPEEWDERLIVTLNEENVMRQLGTIITTSGEHKINIAGTKPAALWVAEGGALTFETDTGFSQVTLDAHKLSVAIKVTNELLHDNAYDLENHLMEQFGRAIANAEEDAFLNGAATDTGRPTGLFVTAAADTNTVTTTASSTAITAENIIDLTYKLKRPYRKNAVFIMHDKTLGAIRKLKDNNQAYIWQPSYAAGEPDTLLGYKVYTSAYAPEIAAGAAVIAFGDMSCYNIADRGVRTFTELRELFAGNDQMGFVMSERVDGALIVPEAVRVLKMKA